MPVLAVGVSVAFGFLAAVLELVFPEKILPALFQLVGSTCLMVWGSALVSQLILRRRADREGTVLPLRMKGFPGLTIFGLVLLALIFAVGFSSPDSSKQLFSTIALVAGIAAACWIGARLTRNRSAAPAEQPTASTPKVAGTGHTAAAPPDQTAQTAKPDASPLALLAVWSAVFRLIAHAPPVTRVTAMDTLPVASGDAAGPLTPAQLRELYSLMVAVRHLDTSAIAWQRQGIIPGYAPELGQEAAQVGSGYAVDTARDFVFPTYREMGVARAMGVDMVAYMSTHKATWHGGLYDPLESRLAPIQAVVAGSVLHAVGWAHGQTLAGTRRRQARRGHDLLR